MAEVIEFKKSGGCDWEDHFYPLNQKLNVNYAGRYVREADYLPLEKERNDLRTELHRVNALCNALRADLAAAVEVLRDTLDGIDKLPPLSAIAGLLEKECTKARAFLARMEGK